MRLTVKHLVRGALIAAVYAAVTFFTAPISFGAVQFRVSEAMTVLPFIMPEAVLGLTVGCFISNIISSSIIDAVFGTLATLLAAYCTMKIRKMWLAPLPAVIFNGIITGGVVTIMTVEFTLEAYLIIASGIAVSELVVCYVLGIPLLIFINGAAKKHGFFR